MRSRDPQKSRALPEIGKKQNSTKGLVTIEIYALAAKYGFKALRLEAEMNKVLFALLLSVITHNALGFLALDSKPGTWSQTRIGTNKVVSTTFHTEHGQHWLYIGKRKGSPAIWATLLSQAEFRHDPKNGFDFISPEMAVVALSRSEKKHGGTSGFSSSYGNSMSLMLWAPGDRLSCSTTMRRLLKRPGLRIRLYSSGEAFIAPLPTRNLHNYFSKIFAGACP